MAQSGLRMSAYSVAVGGKADIEQAASKMLIYGYTP